MKIEILSKSQQKDFDSPPKLSLTKKRLSQYVTKNQLFIQIIINKYF